LVQHGESLHLVGQILNHRDTKTTAGYAYFQTQQRERALTAHGEAVLKFAPVAPATPPAWVYQAPVTRDLPVPQEHQVNRRAHYVTREDLYRLVWEAPVSEVAARFGISDVGLAKACRRAAIPIPPRGYWARAEAGHLLEHPPLQPSPPGLRDKIRLRGRRIAENRDASRAVAVKIAA
jgi:hypothetical protein